MKLIYEVNIMENKKVVVWLNIFAFLLILPFLHLFSFICFSITGIQEVQFYFGLWETLFLFLFMMVLLSIHELIHGLFFKVFMPQNKVKFGFKWKSGMAYATSPGSLYSRGKMLIIGLAPFVFISLGLTVALVMGWISPIVYTIIASLHAAGCIGDFYYTYLLLIKFGKGNILVEDTETGLLIYQV